MHHQYQHPHSLQKTHRADFTASKQASSEAKAFESIAPLLHKRAAQIHGRLRTIEASLKPSELAVFRYIVNNTIGRNKASDCIANCQFTSGKKRREGGGVIDFGCGLKSINAVRKARKSLCEQGLIVISETVDDRGGSLANSYAVSFILELLAAEKMTTSTNQKSRGVHTGGGYHQTPPTIKTSKKFIKQRCSKTLKSKTTKHFYMDPAHVDYLVSLIEQSTGDTHSRGAFAQIALTVSEDIIMELLSILKDRDNITNKGAWFLSSARKYQHTRVIQADQLPPQVATTDEQQPLDASVSLWDRLTQTRPELAASLDMNRVLSTPTTKLSLSKGGYVGD